MLFIFGARVILFLFHPSHHTIDGKYFIYSGIGNYKFREMIRNQSRPKNQQPIMFSPQSSSYNELSHIIIKPYETVDFVPLEKNRTYSHKKLSLTSNFNAQQSVQPARKVVMPVFEANRFYRPVVRANPLVQSKKGNVEESKVSLKISNIGKIEPNSPHKASQQLIEPINERSQTIMEGNQSQKIRKELRQFMGVRLTSLNNEISSQSLIINNLKERVQCLQAEIRNKNHVINSLLAERFQNSQKANQKFFIDSRLGDLEKILPILTSESNKAQKALNLKLDSLTRQLVQMNISSQTKQMGKFKLSLERLQQKVHDWISGQQTKVVSIQQLGSRLEANIKAISSVQEYLKLTEQKIQKLQKEIENKKEYSLAIMDSNDTINCWDTFQDYVLTNRSQTQLKNNSIFSQDDYFFHPEAQPVPQLKSSISSVPSASTVCSTSSAFGQLISLMGHLKDTYGTELPLKCSIDKHNRVLAKEHNRLLMDQTTKTYYKVGSEEVKVLLSRGYISIL